MVDLVMKNKSRFDLLSYADVSPFEFINRVFQTIVFMTPMKEYSTLEKRRTVLNSFASLIKLKS